MCGTTGHGHRNKTKRKKIQFHNVEDSVIKLKGGEEDK